MLMGHTEGLPKFGSSKELLLSGHTSELEGDDEEEISEEILYMASFEYLAAKYVLYDSIIWVSISLLLVLAWGIGVLMLLYLPMRRYVLQKDMSSRKLYVTPNNIVYKVSRPSFIPFWGVTNIERHIPLSLVIDIVIEQGCLQSLYGLHTFRVESIAHGKAAPVDELQVQGVSNPGHLRKVIVKEASKVKRDYGRSWKTTVHGIDEEGMARADSLSEPPAVLRVTSKVPKPQRRSSLSSVACVDVCFLGSRYPSIAEEIKSVASADPANRKLFVRGLAWNTTSEAMCAVCNVWAANNFGSL